MEIEEIQQNLFTGIKKLKAERGYLNAGFPNYNTLFGRDSLISAWQLLPIEPDIAQKTLNVLASYQAKEYNPKKDSEPGKILHEYRFDKKLQQELPWEWPYYGGVDSTSLFIIVLNEYIEATNNITFLKTLWPMVKGALNWHLENAQKNEHGFITYDPQTPNGLLHQGWKDSSNDHLKISPPPVAIVEEQGYAYKAYRSFVSLASILPDEKENKDLVKIAFEHAENIKLNFKKYFWVASEKYFALGLNGQHIKRTAITSNPGHLFLCDDFLDKESAEMIKNRLFRDDMFTMGGIRTLSTQDRDFDALTYHTGSIWPHDNWFIYKGLKEWGFAEEAEKIEQALLLAYQTLHHMPELYAVTEKDSKEEIIVIKKANTLQAWSSGALLNMLNVSENEKIW